MAEVFENDTILHVVTGGTDNHLMTVDLTGTQLNGKEVQNLLDGVFITTNKEAIPEEKLSPFKTSGIRIGTPAITTRGFKEDDCREVANLIIRAIKNADNETVLEEIKRDVFKLTEKYPID